MKKFNRKAIKKLFITAVNIFLAASVFAQGSSGIDKLDTLAQKALDIMSGNFVRILLAIFLCGSAVAYAFNKDNEKVKRNCIAIIVGAAILISASAIIGMVMD